MVSQAIEGWIPAVRSEYPCVEMVEFTQAYRQQSIHDKPLVPIQRPAPQPAPAPTGGQVPRPAPTPSPTSSEGTEWDPWAGSSSGSDGGSQHDEWGGRDPWEEKNRGGGTKRGSW